jgi:hypothetical protein
MGGVMGFLDSIDWKMQSQEPDPDVCQECGGMGEIVLGDGGGEGGKATDTGVSYPCDACDGSGGSALQTTARRALKLMEEGG